MVDIGTYNKNNKLSKKLVEQWYESYPDGVTLPPEYAHFIEHDVNRFLIRLARYKFAAKMLERSDSVLEVGSGSGLGSIFLSQYCKSVTGIDIKSTEIAEAKRFTRRKNVRFIQKDLFDLDDSQVFDAVVALDVIEHMTARTGKRLIAEMARRIRGNGMVIIGTPSIYSYPYQGKLSQASHVKCYDQDELRSLMSPYFGRIIAFSMNDEVVHTGNPKMSWYYFMIGFGKK
jgi:2-polyprenyl-3-methyl-5-hydroxy-6-metoxy-1,4-benzoquinol methylase